MSAHISGQELNYTTPQGPIAIRRWGLGPSHLLIPGLGGNNASWGRVPHLIAGAGKAALGMTPPDWWADLHADDLLTHWCETLVPLIKVLDRPVLAGWSLGAALALRLSELAPVGRLVLIAPSLEGPGAELQKVLSRGYEDWAQALAPHLLPGDEAGARKLGITALSPRLLPLQFRIAARPYPWKEGFEYPPATVVVGAEDRLVDARKARLSVRRLRADLRVLQRGHALPWTNAPELAGLILSDGHESA